MKLELDLYYVITNSNTKFQKTAEKSLENLSVTDGQTDRQQAN